MQYEIKMISIPWINRDVMRTVFFAREKTWKGRENSLISWRYFQELQQGNGNLGGTGLS